MLDRNFNPDTRLWRTILWVLRIGVALQCLGYAREALMLETPLFSFLWNPPEVGGLGWSEVRVVWIHQVAGGFLVVAALLTFFRPCWAVLVPVAIWPLLHSLAKTRMGGDPFYEINVLAQSTRIIAPLGLMLLHAWPQRMAAAFLLLRIGIAVTFAAHGYEAMQLHPKFVDFNIVVVHRLLGWSMSQNMAETILMVIATVDLAAAALLLSFRSRSIAFYMAFWGLATAVARILYAGPAGFSGAYHQALIRSCHAGVPLAIGLYWMLLSKSCHRTKSPASTPTENAHETPEQQHDT